MMEHFLSLMIWPYRLQNLDMDSLLQIEMAHFALCENGQNVKAIVARGKKVIGSATTTSDYVPVRLFA